MSRFNRVNSINGLDNYKKQNYDLGIVTAVKGEFNAILEKMSKYDKVQTFVEDKNTNAEKKFFVGSLNGQKVVLSMSGVGTEDAAICTERMVNKFNVNRIVNVGSAGTNKESVVNLGDCIISEKSVRFDVDLSIFPEYKKGTFDKYSEPFIYAEKSMIEKAIEVCKEKRIPFHKGTVITGNSFINDPKRKKDTIEEFGALCDEMEGASVARYCSNRDIPFVVIRCISDKPIEKENVMYFKYYNETAQRCAEIVEGMSRLLSKDKNRDIILKMKNDIEKLKSVDKIKENKLGVGI